LIPALFIVPLLVVRLRNEEQVLLRDLPGYAEYTQKVKYRLLLGIW
jgi:protein-S-isoprenylcysteine O-methyltransferase Ste14